MPAIAPDFVAVVVKSVAAGYREPARQGRRQCGRRQSGRLQAGAGSLVCAEPASTLKIAVVEGDDVMPRIEALRCDRTCASSIPASRCRQSSSPPTPISARCRSPRRSRRGADIVITGRCVDSALDARRPDARIRLERRRLRRLAAGSLVGHILECGPQATGGLHTDWEQVPDWDNIGYPIVECRADGSFVVDQAGRHRRPGHRRRRSPSRCSTRSAIRPPICCPT